MSFYSWWISYARPRPHLPRLLVPVIAAKCISPKAGASRSTPIIRRTTCRTKPRWSFVFRATKSKDQILIALRRSSNSLNQYSLRLDGNANPRLVSQSEWRDAAEILTPRGFWLDPPPAELQLDKFSFRSPDGRFAASGGYSGITQPGWFGDGRKGTMTVDLLQEGGGAKLVTMRGNFRKTGHQSRGFHPAHLNAFGGLNSRSRRVTPGTVLRDSLSDRTREERAFRSFKPLPPE
jgi:hypothetical protein